MTEYIALTQRRTGLPRQVAERGSIIRGMNRSLRALERQHIKHFQAPRHPTLFIVGPPRAGTTLLSQLLISAFEIGYINNLAARFWEAPYIGLSLASAIHDFSQPPNIDFSSDLGSTSGYEGPHEFGHFWRRWFPYGDSHKLDDRQLSTIDQDSFRREIAAMESVFDRPLLFKNLVCSFQISFLAQVLPRAVFLDCRREPLYVLQSLLKARKESHQPLEAWFSIKPPEYEDLRHRRPEDQIAGQVYYTLQHIDASIQNLDQARYLRVPYEDLVSNPAEQLQRISARLASLANPPIPRPFRPQPFRSSDRQILPDPEFQRLAAAWRRLEQNGHETP